MLKSLRPRNCLQQRWSTSPRGRMPMTLRWLIRSSSLRSQVLAPKTIHARRSVFDHVFSQQSATANCTYQPQPTYSSYHNIPTNRRAARTGCSPLSDPWRDKRWNTTRRRVLQSRRLRLTGTVFGAFQRPGETMWNVYQPSFEGFFIYHLRIAGGMVELMSTIGDCEILKYICLVNFVGCRVYNIMGHHSIPHILRFYCRSCLVIHLHPFLLAIII